MEVGLEALSQDHSAHVNHVIQEFLFGYNILINCRYLRTTYGFEQGRTNTNSDFGELFFSWMVASLLHDVGYDIERAAEEEAFREKKNAFWDFMTHRATTQNPLTFSIEGPGQRIIQEIILKDIQSIPGADLSYVEFENLFLRPVNNRRRWAQYDHGIISAVKYITELEKLEKSRGGNYLNWAPNRNAALAMALHNFRYKDCDLRLNCGNKRSLLPYLLIVSDEIQEWERERIDIDSALPDDSASGGKAKKKTELVGIRFRDKSAYVIVDHRLKDPSLKDALEKYLDKKTTLQKRHYPIRVLFPQLQKGIRARILKSTLSLATRAAVGAIFGIGGVLQSLVEIKPETIGDIQVSVQRLNRLREIAETECTKNLLVPAAPEPIYEIFVDHRIDGDPYLTVVFPL